MHTYLSIQSSLKTLFSKSTLLSDVDGSVILWNIKRVRVLSGSS